MGDEHDPVIGLQEEPESLRSRRSRSGGASTAWRPSTSSAAGSSSSCQPVGSHPARRPGRLKGSKRYRPQQERQVRSVSSSFMAGNWQRGNGQGNHAFRSSRFWLRPARSSDVCTSRQRCEVWTAGRPDRTLVEVLLQRAAEQETGMAFRRDSSHGHSTETPPRRPCCSAADPSHPVELHPNLTSEPKHNGCRTGSVSSVSDAGSRGS